MNYNIVPSWHSEVYGHVHSTTISKLTADAGGNHDELWFILIYHKRIIRQKKILLTHILRTDKYSHTHTHTPTHIHTHASLCIRRYVCVEIWCEGWCPNTLYSYILTEFDTISRYLTLCSKHCQEFVTISALAQETLR